MSDTLLEFIEQVVLEELAPEADEDEVFGQWLDPDKRRLSVKEPNTPEETAAISALTSFMSWRNDPSKLSANNGKYAKMFLDLMQKHQYSPVLDPDVGFVYRGLYFEDKGKYIDFFSTHTPKGFTVYDANNTVIDHGTQTIFDVIQNVPYHRIEGYLGQFNLNPQGNALVQSWSEDISIACGFANPWGSGGVVLRANTDENNFFGKPGEIGKLANAPDEKETISVGTVKVAFGMFVISSKFIDEIDFQKRIEALEG